MKPTPSPSARVGPAGWEHSHWQGVVYPKPASSRFHPLEFVASYFDVADVSSSFSRFLRPEVSRLWLAKVSRNPTFVFTARLHRRFTYERVAEPAEVGMYKEGLWPLVRAEKLACLVMQFPWSFRFTEENREYLIRLRRLFHEFPLVAEFRHESWLADEALGTLIDYRLGFANLDLPEQARAMPPTAVVTSSIALVKLHGRNRRFWRNEFETGQPYWRPAPNDYLYSPAELEPWRQRIEHISAHAAATYVITTNDFRGKSVVNALQIQGLLGQARREALVRSAVA